MIRTPEKKSINAMFGHLCRHVSRGRVKPGTSRVFSHQLSTYEKAPRRLWACMSADFGSPVGLRNLWLANSRAVHCVPRVPKTNRDPPRVSLYLKRRGGDSNSREALRPLLVFETSPFNRSGTSPCKRSDEHPSLGRRAPASNPSGFAVRGLGHSPDPRVPHSSIGVVQCSLCTSRP